MTIPEIANFLVDLQKENRSILVILNTKKMVNKLYDALKPLVPQETAPLYCVTTRLCSRHRGGCAEADHRAPQCRFASDLCQHPAV